jgi:hypothetical protein
VLLTNAARQRRDAIGERGRDDLNTLAAFGMLAQAAEWLADALDAKDPAIADRFALEALRLVEDGERRARMSVERAREITRGVLMNRLAAQGVEEEQCKLPDCDLEEMLVACRIVGGEAGKTRTTKPDGTTTTTFQMTVDPRGVALAYVAENFPHPDDIVEGLNLTIGGAEGLRDWLTERIDEVKRDREEEEPS